MEFSDLIKTRHAVRKYTSEKPSRSQIEQVLEAGRMAPSACNFQPVKFLVISADDKLKLLNECTNTHGAPAVIVVCAQPELAWVRPCDAQNSAVIDAAIATDHMMLCAASVGLGSLWIGQFDPARLKSIFSLPNGIEPLSILALGYEHGQQAEKKRKPLESLLIHR